MAIDAASAKWLSCGMVACSLIIVIGLNSAVSTGMELFRAGMRDARFSGSSVHIPSSFSIRFDADSDLTVKPLEVKVTGAE